MKPLLTFVFRCFPDGTYYMIRAFEYGTHENIYDFDCFSELSDMFPDVFKALINLACQSCSIKGSDLSDGLFNRVYTNIDKYFIKAYYNKVGQIVVRVYELS